VKSTRSTESVNGDRKNEVTRRRFLRWPRRASSIRAITTSEIKVLDADAYTELAVRTLHTLYGLDAK
jgi:aspartate kinase